MQTDRIILLVLDSLGIGSSADAKDFGDSGSDTLGHIADTFAKDQALQLPNMCRLGLAHSYHTSTGKYPAAMSIPDSLLGSFACAKEISTGKDTPSGHWEMMGVPALWDWGYFHEKENSFPQKLLDEIVRKSGKAVWQEPGGVGISFVDAASYR